MSKITIPLVIASLITLLLAVPLTDYNNQRNSLFSIIRGQNNNAHRVKMRPISLRDKTGLNCPEAGFFVNPQNCSRFYRCVDVAQTGFFSIFNYECASGQVFSMDSNTCIPGICSLTSSMPQGEQTPQGPTSENSQPILANPPDNSPPAPPPPPPSPTPPTVPETSPTTESQTSQTQFQIPQWMTQLPPWFNEVPWWFKTPPSWYNQPPAWFNAPPSAHIIPEEITLDNSEPIGPHTDVATGFNPYKIKKEIATGSNISMSGIDNTLLYDNKTIRIHIPIHIVQQ